MLTAADLYFQAHEDEVGSWFCRCHELSRVVGDFMEETLGVKNQLLWLRSELNDDYLMPAETAEIMEGTSWRFHVVVEIDGLVHDPWSCLPPTQRAEYLETFFPNNKVVVFQGNFTHEDLARQACDPTYAAFCKESFVFDV